MEDFFPIVTCQSWMASRTRTFFFCLWGIDWMVVVCYWWVSCEWQPGCPALTPVNVSSERRDVAEWGKGSSFD